MGECVGRALVRVPATAAGGNASSSSSSLRLPVAFLICNQPAGVDGRPSLMSFEEVLTLFHEMGHVTQHLFTTVDHSFAAGIRLVQWDAVELASQFLENFCYDRRTLAALSSHVDTGASLPADLYDALYASRNFRAASALLRQIQFSAVDMGLHDARGVPALVHAAETVVCTLEGDDATVSVPKAQLDAVTQGVRSLEQSLNERASVMPFNPRSRFLHSFSHIFAGGYSAGYYSYKWAEVMSADAFEAFAEAAEAAEKGASSPAAAEADRDRRWRELGLRYRDTVLALGGSVDAAEVFRMFRGRDPATTPLLKQAGLLADSKQ